MDPLQQQQQQQQPPPVEVAQQAYRVHTAHGSVGPVIGVLALVLMLGAVAVMVGRLCSGRGIRGHAKYDFEGWVETKCASCIDGRVDPIPPPSRVVVEHRVGSASGEGGERAAPPPEERGAGEEGGESQRQHE